MENAGIFAAWKSWAPQILGITRIIAAAIFVTTGTTKLFAFPAGMPPPSAPTAELNSITGIGGLLELIGGLLLLLGLLTRPTAFILSGMMAVAYFKFHAASGGFWPTINGGTAAILYCFLWLYISAAGPGAFSLDALLAGRRRNKN